MRRKYCGNPPLEIYYARAVFLRALWRLDEIAQAIKGFETEMTGKAYQVAEGVRVRGKGVLPSLRRQFPELRGFSDKIGPQDYVRMITGRKKTPEYFALLNHAVREVENHEGNSIETWVQRAPQSELQALPPVQYPPHKGTAQCKHCRQFHSTDLHRFHLRGARLRTHPKESGAKAKVKRRIASEVPF